MAQWHSLFGHTNWVLHECPVCGLHVPFCCSIALIVFVMPVDEVVSHIDYL